MHVHMCVLCDCVHDSVACVSLCECVWIGLGAIIF